jgi:hypothetical protein
VIPWEAAVGGWLGRCRREQKWHISSLRAHDPQKIFSVRNVKYIEMVPKDSVPTSEKTPALAKPNSLMLTGEVFCVTRSMLSAQIP